MNPIKSRKEIITDMCYTWRHDFGLERDPNNPLSSGMTLAERDRLWLNMAQVFDNSVMPYVTLKEKETNG